MSQPLCFPRTVWKSIWELHVAKHIVFKKAISFSCICPRVRKIYDHKKNCMWMLIATLLIRASGLKIINSHQQVNKRSKLQSIHIVEVYTPVRRRQMHNIYESQKHHLSEKSQALKLLFYLYNIQHVCVYIFIYLYIIFSIYIQYNYNSQYIQYIYSVYVYIQNRYIQCTYNIQSKKNVQR